MFTPYVEPPAANGDDAETLGVELGYGNNFGYYGLQANLSPALCERMLCSERAKELQEIQVGLEQLILEPGEFETWSNAIRERTTNPSFKIDALKIAVEMIIQLAAFTSSSQTVQYNLAKLCSFLCRDLHTFQDDMIASLLCFHEEQRSNLSDQQRKNLLLFFAEIYEKLESKKSSQMQAFENALLEQIKEVLVADRLDDSKVKVVVEVLKLTGRYLDTHEGTSKINEILTQLNAIAKAHPAISDSVKERILSLNTWRENKWDVRNFRSNKEEKPATDQGRKENDQGLIPSCSSSFIIGPDGQPLTEEERAFLEESFRKLDNNDTILDNDDVSDEYDEFLSAVADEEAKKRVAEMEMAEMEKQMAKTNLDGRDEVPQNRGENGKDMAT
uniref:MIF4G domain-containing protein n=1 Tax=Elaeophora elaphi TaxID=1147741 RepID=A0A0R3RRP3_9BILA